jgi:hypothetical protein
MAGKRPADVEGCLKHFSKLSGVVEAREEFSIPIIDNTQYCELEDSHNQPISLTLLRLDVQTWFYFRGKMRHMEPRIATSSLRHAKLSLAKRDACEAGCRTPLAKLFIPFALLQQHLKPVSTHHRTSTLQMYLYSRPRTLRSARMLTTSQRIQQAAFKPQPSHIEPVPLRTSHLKPTQCLPPPLPPSPRPLAPSSSPRAASARALAPTTARAAASRARSCKATGEDMW